ncbi:unnamed protein product [Klebsiella pneumoniae subsp. rhinoscleromatis SB3432]|nr:unnamed protein product [Klebsiella pneumoniae subsp. rhinoscleromatis SB3432]
MLNAIPGIRHAFLDVHETAAFPYAELAPVKLVHGNEVHHYQQPLPTRPHADAVFTAVAGQKVGVVTADCLPLLIASRDGRYVCSVHAGWQGLVSGIVDNSLACFRQQGVALADLVIAVGPHIHPCCYEVSAGFYQQLLDQPGGDRVARHRQRLFHSRSGPVSDPLKAAARGSDNLWFDLRAFAEAIFAEAGGGGAAHAQYRLNDSWTARFYYSYSQDHYNDNQARVMAYDSATGFLIRRVDGTHGSTQKDALHPLRPARTSGIGRLIFQAADRFLLKELISRCFLFYCFFINYLCLYYIKSRTTDHLYYL